MWAWTGCVDQAPPVGPLPDTSVSAVVIVGGDRSLAVGQVVQLSVSVTVSGDASEGVVWGSGDATVVTVSDAGLVTANAVGSADITATSVFDDTISDTITITVGVTIPAVSEVVINEGDQALSVGDDAQLTVTVTASGGASEDVAWTSSDDTIASVDASGLVTANAVGSADITATSVFDDTISDTVAIEATSANTLLIAGQSNAVGWGKPLDTSEPGSPSVRAFGNDYVWKQAYEPLDDGAGQVDSVSYDATTLYSFGLTLGLRLHEATGERSYLIPSARGATSTSYWLPRADRLDRSSLFGSANYRAQTSAGTVINEYPAEGGRVNALVWYQGEADSGSLDGRSGFIGRTTTIMDAFVAELDVPVLYVQLAAHEHVDSNAEQQVIREYQRLLETGASIDAGSGAPQPRDRHYMVVAHDLPMSDSIHLSAAGQRVLGERLALAYRQYVLRHAVNGTGPRLVAITQPTAWHIRVTTTRPLNDPPGYDGAFTVLDEGATSLSIVQEGRDPDDSTSVLLELNRQTEGSVTVRYMPPGRPAGDQPRQNVVRDTDGLPLPAFGTHGGQ